jgi:predicted transcriptional regulator
MKGTTIMATELYGNLIREADQRRVSREDKSTYDIKAFWQRHHEICNLAAQGFKQTEIAYILGIHPQTVSNTLNSTLGEEKLSIIRKERDEDAKLMIERIRVLRDKALKVYQELFDQHDESGNSVDCSMTQRLHAADVVTLEIAQMKAPTRIQATSTHTILTGQDLLAIKERAIKEAKNCGLVIEAEAEEVNETLPN